jgi:hypothetical protein
MLKQTKEFNSSRNDEMAIIIIFRNIVQPKWKGSITSERLGNSEISYFNVH